MGFAEARGRTVYVSRGLGEVRYPVRTLCPPELCLFEIS
jgi:predicted MPP superfamily phosphohydrolase